MDIVDKHATLLESGHHPHVRSAISAAILEAFKADESRDIPRDMLARAIIVGIKTYLSAHPDTTHWNMVSWQNLSVAKRLAGEVQASIRHMRGILGQHKKAQGRDE